MRGEVIMLVVPTNELFSVEAQVRLLGMAGLPKLKVSSNLPVAVNCQKSITAYENQMSSLRLVSSPQVALAHIAVR